MPQTIDLCPSTTEQEQPYFRCPIPAESQAAKLRVSGKKYRVRVEESSIDGFTVSLPESLLRKIKLGTTVVLHYDGMVLEMFVHAYANGEIATQQVVLHRLRDLTPKPRIGTWVPAFLRRRMHSEATHTELMYVGFVMVLFLLVALPGVGDQLGTADRIQNGLQNLVKGIGTELNAWW